MTKDYDIVLAIKSRCLILKRDRFEGSGERPTQRQHRANSSNFFLIEYTWAFVLFVLAYTAPGLIGHQPWKQDETYIIEIVRSMLVSHDFVVPTMAGETFMEKPPLYYWVACGFVKLLTPLVTLHDAARMATGFFIVQTCMALKKSGSRWYDSEFGCTTVLVFLACLGLQAYGHLMLTDIALLAGIAIGFSGFSGLPSSPVKSGLEIGTGIGIGFLAKGILAPGFFAVSCLALPLAFKRWRNATYARALLIAGAAALPWLLAWPAALYLRSPALFSDWLWLNNIGRFLGFAVPTLGAAHDDGFWAKNLWWITFPAAPLAALTVWRARRAVQDNQLVQVCIAFTAVIMGVLLFSASARGGYALPLLIPLSLLGAGSARSLPPNLERISYWTAGLAFSTLALLIWAAWLLVVSGEPKFSTRFIHGVLAPDLDRRINIATVLISLFATVAAAFLMWKRPRQSALQTWAVGIALCWLLLANLFIVWVDQVKAYKNVFAALQSALPANTDCVASYGLGESERAMLSYYDAITTKRLELEPRATCHTVLVEGLLMRPPTSVMRSLGKEIWQGARPADTREHFWLYERQEDGEHP